MPEAFCGIEIVRYKVLFNLWVLWEKKLPSIREKLLFASLLVSSLAVTLCDICMPKAFCELETVRKEVLLNLWDLWEKKLPCIREKPHNNPCKQASRGNLTFHSPPCGGGVGGGASWCRVWGQSFRDEGPAGAKPILTSSTSPTYPSGGYKQHRYPCHWGHCCR